MWNQSSGGPTLSGRSSKSRWCIAFLTALALSMAAGCGNSSTDQAGGKSGGGDILIGAPMPLTGGGAAFGVPALNAMQLAIDDINKSGGIKEFGGAKLKLKVVDTRSDPVLAGQVLRQMSTENISALVGPMLSAEVVTNVPLIQRLGIPVFSAYLDDRATDNNDGGYIFRVNDRSAAWGKQGVDYLKSLEKEKGTSIERVGLVSINVPPGTSTAEAIKAGAQENGWSVTNVAYDQKTTKDFAPIVAKLKEANVQVVTGYQNPGDAILFAKAIAAQSWRPQYGFFWVAGGQYLNSFKKELGGSVNGWMDVSYTAALASGYFPQGVHSIAEQFASKYNEPLTGYAAASVSVVAVIAEAVAKAKSRNPKDVAAAARELKFANASAFHYPYWTMYGGLEFNKSQDNVAWRGAVIQLAGTDGQTVVSPSEAATGPVKWPQGR